MKILGIESSCDETTAAVVEDGHILLSNVISSSMDMQSVYGGVVPEIAARSHIEVIMPVIENALRQAKVTWQDIDGIAIVNGAGLSGSLLVGVLTARTLAIIKKKPLYNINHVEAHIYANFINSSLLNNYKLPKNEPLFPALALIVSGGHTQLALFKNHFNYQLLGQTHDDAIGEAFDKVAKMLGLPYPGGPVVERLATKGDPNKYQLPKAKLEAKYDFSFSGPKTAVLRLAQNLIEEDYTFPSYKLADRLSDTQKQDIAASFVRVSIETVVDKALMAYQEFKPKSVLIGGGVASSPELRHQLSEKIPIDIEYPDPKLCTDNAAMVAALGCFKAKAGHDIADPYSLAISPNLTM